MFKIDKREELLRTYLDEHQKNLSMKILLIAFIYLLASISWNLLFKWLDLAYSRANLQLLIASFVILVLIILLNRMKPFPSGLVPHVVLLYSIIVVCSLYFGSGYYEAWSFFLLIPLLTGLYAKKKIMLGYIVLGLGILIWFSVQFPLQPQPIDNIDISNRILLYIIVATISYILVEQLLSIYNNKVNIILESADATIEQVVKSFILSVEAKDTYTFGHSERVSQYAVELAMLLPQFQNEERLKSLRLAGLLHDIGKINISESILTKPGKLTEGEYEVIKTHPVVGARMVDKIPSLSMLRNGVLYHHERWDGNGYPSGLAGSNIPLEARVLAVADAFDAMTSSRAYRDANTFNEAMKRLNEGKGTQFAPELIELLPQAEIKWKKTYNSYNNELDEFERLSDLF